MRKAGDHAWELGVAHLRHASPNTKQNDKSPGDGGDTGRGSSRIIGHPLQLDVLRSRRDKE